MSLQFGIINADLGYKLKGLKKNHISQELPERITNVVTAAG